MLRGLIGATFTDMPLEEIEALVQEMRGNPQAFNGVIHWFMCSVIILIFAAQWRTVKAVRRASARRQITRVNVSVP